MSPRIAIVGAGSSVFALSMIRDLCLTPGLNGSTVTFMDVDRTRLDSSHELCTRYAAELGVRLDIRKTTSRKTCLTGADFVIHTALASGGAYPKLAEGWNIGKRHGYRFGGSLHIMHDEAFWVNFYQVRLMEELARDMLKICPSAWLLLVANPVFMGTTLLGRRYPRLKCVGLCHGSGEVYWIAEKLGVKRPESVKFEAPGVNHFVWLTKLSHRGRDLFPALDRWIARKAGRANSGEARLKKADLYRIYGAFPLGDLADVGGGTWPHWYHVDRATERRFGEDPDRWWRGHLRSCATAFGYIARMLRKPGLKLTEHFGTRRSGEPMIPVVEAIARNRPRVRVVNVMNTRELVPGIPRNVAVEVAGRCSGRGIEGLKSGGLPPAALAATLRDCVAPMETELEAYLKGSRVTLLELVKMDPWTSSSRQAESFLRAILSRHPALQRHYR